MGTNRSSETTTFAEYLRTARTTTQSQVDKAAATHRSEDFTATERAAYTTSER